MKRYIFTVILLLLGFSISPAGVAVHHPMKTTENTKWQKPPIKKRHIRLLKRLKNTPPRKGDDLWILRLLYLVAFLGILTFATAAIVMATSGLTALWVTLMIIGGIVGILPYLLVGAALLFR